jgi:hypothetical protein
VSDVITRDGVADADEFAPFMCEGVVIILAEVVVKHRPKRPAAGPIVGIPEDDVNGQLEP